ncbi:dihydrolipoyl dehydrogenase [Candidatus Tremblaya phenacola]|uniref:Dihydrolipoyl dehydrogenase n=1 Tax=Candidatus Tremblayella phenacoccinincola TaxID=1010676 RepID=A0A2G0V789_9PROT|nr:dihydrolipoyl dehydrogenase [Candidatus Tremblaya phenacola]PHN16328.1 Dihydrolipoyl dehydrogenase [Candidatus Tremblaya phenacola]
MNFKHKTNVIVIGSGPGGYSAAFRCADLNLNTILIEQYNNIGGVCLNVGCVPSKALLHLVKLISEIKTIKSYGLLYNNEELNINIIRSWKDKIIIKANGSLYMLAKARNIKVINGYSYFVNNKHIQVNNNKSISVVRFETIIIAAGSKHIQLPTIKPICYKNIWTSSDALSLTIIPKTSLAIGGGIIGLELATIYAYLGSVVTIIESFNQLLPAVDKDIVNAFIQEVNPKANIILTTKTIAIKSRRYKTYTKLYNKDIYTVLKSYDIIITAVGRLPNINILSLEKTNVKTIKGYINVNKQLRTNISYIYGIGDVIGIPMLAHKASNEAHIVADVIAGKRVYFEPKAIPTIIYTNPELALVGYTERKAIEHNISYEVSIVPWLASSKAIISNTSYGITKLIFDIKTNKIIGGLIVGSEAGELIGELSLAIEMSCDAEDIILSIHAHPTLYETIAIASQLYTGTVTDLLNNPKKH